MAQELALGATRTKASWKHIADQTRCAGSACISVRSSVHPIALTDILNNPRQTGGIKLPPVISEERIQTSSFATLLICHRFAAYRLSNVEIDFSARFAHARPAKHFRTALMLLPPRFQACLRFVVERLGELELGASLRKNRCRHGERAECHLGTAPCTAMPLLSAIPISGLTHEMRISQYKQSNLYSPAMQDDPVAPYPQPCTAIPSRSPLKTFPHRRAVVAFRRRLGVDPHIALAGVVHITASRFACAFLCCVCDVVLAYLDSLVMRTGGED